MSVTNAITKAALVHHECLSLLEDECISLYSGSDLINGPILAIELSGPQNGIEPMDTLMDTERLCMWTYGYLEDTQIYKMMEFEIMETYMLDI